jgi:CTP synthase
VVTERHRHRYEANVNYLTKLAQGRPGDFGADAARAPDGNRRAAANVHPWFMGVQFHPEFKSTPWDGHPAVQCLHQGRADHQAAGNKSLKAVA